MGGAESEENDQTRNVLLEGAAWHFTNIRRTLSAQRMSSEAAYRFSRGVHPALAEAGVRRGLELMRLWSGGIVSEGLVDNYPLPPIDPTVEFTNLRLGRHPKVKQSSLKSLALHMLNNLTATVI